MNKNIFNVISKILKLTDYYVNLLNYFVYQMFNGLLLISRVLSPVFILYKLGRLFHCYNFSRRLGKYCYLTENWGNHVLNTGIDIGSLGTSFALIVFSSILFSLLVSELCPIYIKTECFWVVQTLLVGIILHAVLSIKKTKKYIKFFYKQRKKYIVWDMFVVLIIVSLIVLCLILRKVLTMWYGLLNYL